MTTEPLDPGALSAALARYDEALATIAASRLPELVACVRVVLPKVLASRDPAYATLEELARATEWKMKRGTWRARNLVLVRGNDPAEVERVTRDAFAIAGDPRKPVATIATLAGVGPATASALLSAVRPDVHPFFDEVVANALPGLGPVAFTLPYYVRYAARLRDEAARLGPPWTAHAIAQALWAQATLPRA